VRGAPLAVLVVVAAVEMADRGWTILELTVLGPMLAATLAGPHLTAAYAVVAVVTVALLGIYEGLYSPPDVGPLAQLVRLCGVTVGGVMAVLVSRYHTRRETKLEKVTHVAQVAQRAILASVPPVSGGVRLAVHYESAAAEASVGGDLYEVTDSPWGVRLLIGDVRGKGLDAVHLASRVLGGFRIVARRTADLRGVLADLDAEVTGVSGPDDFVTAAVVQIHGHGGTVVNAGHPDPVLLRAGTARLLTVPTRQPPLGLGTGYAPATTVGLQPGDRLLLYTDGLMEARHPVTGQFFPLLPAVRAALTCAPLQAGLDDLVRRVRHWTGSGLTDDVALLVAEIPDQP
jgi:serine phosphatase RsbU (regulator of sigma subunit)